MTVVRPCIAGDVPALADLFVTVFRGGTQPATDALRDYFAELYLGNPWVDESTPSLVLADAADRAVGFLGALPMPLRMRGRDVRAVIGGNFMIHPDHREPLASARMLRRFFGAGQDLTLTDTANAIAIKQWQGLGGEQAHFASMSWVLPIRPARFGLTVLARRRSAKPLAVAMRPVAALADRVGTRRLRVTVPQGSALTAITAAEAHAFLTGLDDPAQLAYAGTASGFEWLVGMARRKRGIGELEVLALRESGTIVGVTLVYPNPGGLGQVLHLAAAKGRHGTLLTALRAHAHEAGSVAIMGQADHRLAGELRALPCMYLYRNDFVMLHARDRELVTPLRTGDVAMSRISGEWWTAVQPDDLR